MSDVLFLCVENAGRSQMAEAFFNHYSRSARAESAGTSPARDLNPVVVEVMREVGVDMEGMKPKVLTPSMAGGFKAYVSLGCMDRNACPAIPGMLDWGMEDPRGQDVERVRAIRDMIRARVLKLLEEMGDAPQS